MMYGVTKSILVSALTLLLAACHEPNPDFTMNLRSPDGNRAAMLRGFQPRGTIDGYILLTFSDQSDNSVIFRQIDKGQIGWISNDTLAIIVDKLEFNSLASEYFPDGTVKSRIKVIVCARQDMDCSALTNRLQRVEARSIAHFPEG